MWKVLFPYVILFAVTDTMLKTYKKKDEYTKQLFNLLGNLTANLEVIFCFYLLIIGEKTFSKL